VSRFQPLRPKSYSFKKCVMGLTLATVVAVPTATAQTVLAPTTLAPTIPEITNQAIASYENKTSSTAQVSNTATNIITLRSKPGLVDPLGIITGCNGQLLPSYAGYTVTLFDAAADGLNLAAQVRLTPTSTDGIPPNSFNKNPFALSDSVADEDRGKYNFLFNRGEGQLDIGRKYILVVKPPAGSAFGERRVLLEITNFDFVTKKLSYRATSLDGRPLATTINQNAVSDSLIIPDAAVVGLSLISLGLDTGICEDKPVQIVKSADRATAEPGDTVVYRLTLKNQSSTAIENTIVSDILPLGISLRTNTIRAQIGDRKIPVAVTQEGNIARFKLCADGTTPVTTTPGNTACVGATRFILAGEAINLAYAVTIDADAIRGTGKNTAIWTGQRSDGGPNINDQDSYTLIIRQGLIRDTGTIIGRVFVDKNFDGQQQLNEPGIPNAVVFMDDGNRITTDANGLFSVQAAVAGYRTGALDIGSLPGYSLAPNLYFSERNSRSRLVKLAPNGLVRMNFGVTPTAREVK
jgi:uncharacterized repeat protein (TIGR01451 family)